jgi:hypothetical protein
MADLEDQKYNINRFNEFNEITSSYKNYTIKGSNDDDRRFRFCRR